MQSYTVRPVPRDALRDDLDLDHHSCFEVARHMAGKLVAPRLRKRPLQFVRLPRGDVLDLRLALLAIRLCLQGFVDLTRGLDDELVHRRAFIANREDIGFAYPEGGALRPDDKVVDDHAD